MKSSRRWAGDSGAKRSASSCAPSACAPSGWACALTGDAGAFDAVVGDSVAPRRSSGQRPARAVAGRLETRATQFRDGAGIGMRLGRMSERSDAMGLFSPSSALPTPNNFALSFAMNDQVTDSTIPRAAGARRPRCRAKEHDEFATFHCSQFRRVPPTLPVLPTEKIAQRRPLRCGISIQPMSLV